MGNPVLVEVTRGDRVESRHRGAFVICDADGARMAAIGDLELPVFPRSAVKALQALPLVESGAADAFGFGARELALAQASHGGEPAHVEGVLAMLAAIGLDETALECGTQTPSHHASAAELIRRGEKPSQLHNECSGKHANFLAVARHLGIDHRDYVGPHHPVQELVRAALQDMTGAEHGADICGTDGCSIPTCAVPLPAIARGFARLANGEGLAPARAEAARRLYAASTSEPFYVAGTGRFDTGAMTLLKGAALVKTGAEGIYCAALPGPGVGIALKCDDGGTRAAEAIMAALLSRLLLDQEGVLAQWSRAPVRTRRGVQVGEVRAVTSAFAGVG